MPEIYGLPAGVFNSEIGEPLGFNVFWVWRTPAGRPQISGASAPFRSWEKELEPGRVEFELGRVRAHKFAKLSIYRPPHHCNNNCAIPEEPELFENLKFGCCQIYQIIHDPPPPPQECCSAILEYSSTIYCYSSSSECSSLTWNVHFYMHLNWTGQDFAALRERSRTPLWK